MGLRLKGHPREREHVLRTTLACRPQAGEGRNLLPQVARGQVRHPPNFSSPFARGVYRRGVELSTRTPDVERQAAAARFLSACGLTLSIGLLRHGPGQRQHLQRAQKQRGPRAQRHCFQGP